MFSSSWSSRWALVAILWATLITNVFASVLYCSDLNTATTEKYSSIYQSNGLCSDHCRPTSAFAIVQGDGCWCSDYVPGTTTQGCENPCPGYPAELCGGASVFGYIALTNAPLGTKGAPSSAPATSAAPTTPAKTSTPPPPPPPNVDTTSTVPENSPTWTPTPVISLETVTGQVRTVTVTPTIPPTSLQNAGNRVPKASVDTEKAGLSTGGAVGLTIGLIVLCATVAAMIWYYMRKKKQERTEEDGFNSMSRTGSFNGALGGPTPSRTMSENSRYILGTNGREVVEAWEHDPEPAGSRRSGPLRPVDQRLDPFAPPYRLGDNRSRDSVNTIRDDHDYSRRVQPTHPILRVNNPD